MRWIGIFSALLLAGCGDQDQVNIRGDTPEPYHLSRCTQEYMKAQHAAKALPRCVAVDWNEVTDLNLKLEARRALEAGDGNY
jgi:hypothetical protein